MMIRREIVYSHFDPKIRSVLGSVRVLLDVSEVQELFETVQHVDRAVPRSRT